jgi:hypothetical protein
MSPSEEERSLANRDIIRMILPAGLGAAIFTLGHVAPYNPGHSRGVPRLRGSACGRGPNATTAFDNFGERQLHEHRAVTVCNVIGVLAWVLPFPEEFGPQLSGDFERLEVGLFNAAKSVPSSSGATVRSPRRRFR